VAEDGAHQPGARLPGFEPAHQGNRQSGQHAAGNQL